MLPHLTLDDEFFSDLVKQGTKMLPFLCPDWTDYNMHDPGITFMELFVWLKEIQQFHMDQIGPMHIKRYLSLMGIKPFEKIPSGACVQVKNGKNPVFFPKGSRFFASDICFETTESVRIGTVEPCRLISMTSDGNIEAAVTGNKMRFPAFGFTPGSGCELRIGLNGSLEPETWYKLYFGFYHDSRWKRNPIEHVESFIPLADIRVDYRSAEGYKEAIAGMDTTCQMLKDGFLSFKINGRMEAGEKGMYWIRFVLCNCDYDSPPLIEGISLKQINVRQTETLAEFHDFTLEAGEDFTVDTRLAFYGDDTLFVSEKGGYTKYLGKTEKRIEKDKAIFRFPELCSNECGNEMKRTKKSIFCRLICFEPEYAGYLLLGEGTGLPCQKFQIGIPDLCSEGLSIMVESETESNCFQTWEKCGDMSVLGPEDCCYLFEEETGTIFFGDCDHGRAPEGMILLTGAVRSLGIRGSVKAGSISRCEREIPGVAVINEEDAFPGRDTERMEQCSARLRLQLKEYTRAVTYEDYEYLVKQTPGLMIEQVKAVPVTERKHHDKTMEEDTVAIVIKPYSQEKFPHLSESYKKNIMQRLEEVRIVGTNIRLMAPEYIGILVFVEAETDIPGQALETDIRQAMDVYFTEGAAEFGKTISCSTIYGMMDVQNQGVRIKSLSIDAQGRSVRRSMNGDLILPVNGLAYLKDLSCMIIPCG